MYYVIRFFCNYQISNLAEHRISEMIGMVLTKRGQYVRQSHILPMVNLFMVCTLDTVLSQTLKLINIDGIHCNFLQGA
jgi:hypothetical protein